MGEYYAGKSYQKHIHFPKTGILCKKDSLARLIKREEDELAAINSESSDDTAPIAAGAKPITQSMLVVAGNGKLGFKRKE